jgi:hypothetical protein
MSHIDIHKTFEIDPASGEQKTWMDSTTAETQPVKMLPLVEYSVAAHRSGLGILRLGYLPAVPGPGLSEDEAKKSISYVDVTLTEQTCAVLGPLISELGQRLADAKRRRS